MFIKIQIPLLLTVCFTGISQAAIITISDIDPAAGTYSSFTSTGSGNTFTLTRTFDFDAGGVDDTLSFDLIRTTYSSGTISGTDVTVGSVVDAGNTTNWYSNFGDAETMQFEVENISYTSGEMDGATAVFDGFQSVGRINVNVGNGGAGAVSVDYLIHTGPTGSTTITSTGTEDLVLTSVGNSSTVFITAESGSGGIRLRDLDLQFSVVPEPSTTALLISICSAFVLVNRRNSLKR